MCTCEEPTIFDEHIHFLPTEPCQNAISWITMVNFFCIICEFIFTLQLIQVRDPVEMFISRYFYARRTVMIQDVCNTKQNMSIRLAKSFFVKHNVTL